MFVYSLFDILRVNLITLPLVTEEPQSRWPAGQSILLETMKLLVIKFLNIIVTLPSILEMSIIIWFYMHKTFIILSTNLIKYENCN